MAQNFSFTTGEGIPVVSQKIEEQTKALEAKAHADLNGYLTAYGMRLVEDGHDVSIVAASVTSAVAKTGIDSMAFVHGVPHHKRGELVQFVMSEVNQLCQRLAA
jgi:hypothetical protein